MTVRIGFDTETIEKKYILSGVDTVMIAMEGAG